MLVSPIPADAVSTRAELVVNEGLDYPTIHRNNLGTDPSTFGHIKGYLCATGKRIGDVLKNHQITVAEIGRQAIRGSRESV